MQNFPVASVPTDDRYPSKSLGLILYTCALFIQIITTTLVFFLRTLFLSFHDFLSDLLCLSGLPSQFECNFWSFTHKAKFRILYLFQLGKQHAPNSLMCLLSMPQTRDTILEVFNSLPFEQLGFNLILGFADQPWPQADISQNQLKLICDEQTSQSFSLTIDLYLKLPILLFTTNTKKALNP